MFYLSLKTFLFVLQLKNLFNSFKAGKSLITLFNAEDDIFKITKTKKSLYQSVKIFD